MQKLFLKIKTIMTKHKTIEDVLESWGKSKQKFPTNNDVLKNEILSKAPVTFETIDRTNLPRRSPFMWLSFAFSAMAVFVFIINAVGYKNNFSTSTDLGISVSNEIRTGLMPSSDSYKSVSIMPPYYGGGELPISDNREFLKVNYNATLRTRDINDLKNKVEITVRALRGRIDSSSGGEKSGYVSFAIPKNELEALKIEMKDLVGVKFYDEQTSSQNLLRDKQMIEENQKQTENSLSNLQSERSQIVKNHNQNLASFQARINSINIEINALNLEYQSASSTRKAEITNRLNQIQVEMNAIQSEIAKENKSYQTKINDVDTRIRNTQENLRSIKIQDISLLDNVATVNGSISLSFISLWEMADIYTPGPLFAWILFAIGLIFFAWNRYYTRVSYLDFY